VLSVQGKEEASLPKKFLYELYEEGYTLVEKSTATDPVFQYVSMQLVRSGVVFSGNELKEAVVNYQRDNKEMLVNNYGNLLKMYVHVGMKDDLPSAFDVHVSELENNQRLANGFDINCLALFLDCEIVVYFPNESDELGLCRYNCNGKKWKRHIAMVFNGHRFPYHVFSFIRRIGLIILMQNSCQVMNEIKNNGGCEMFVGKGVFKRLVSNTDVISKIKVVLSLSRQRGGTLHILALHSCLDLQ
jgi:hypothetical protein